METKDILLFVVPILTSLISGFVAYKFSVYKIQAETILKYKEEKYSNIVSALSGFVSGSADGIKKDDLIQEKYKAWLFASDEVIKSIDAMIDYVSKNPGDEHSNVVANVVLEIRRDLIGRKSKLKPSDIKFHQIKYD